MSLQNMCSVPSPNPTQNGVTDLHRRRGEGRYEHVGNVDRWRRWDPSGAYIECAAVLGAEFRLRMRPNSRWTLPPPPSLVPQPCYCIIKATISSSLRCASVHSRCIGIRSTPASNISFSWDTTFGAGYGTKVFFSYGGCRRTRSKTSHLYGLSLFYRNYVGQVAGLYLQKTT